MLPIRAQPVKLRMLCDSDVSMLIRFCLEYFFIKCPYVATVVGPGWRVVMTATLWLETVAARHALLNLAILARVAQLLPLTHASLVRRSYKHASFTLLSSLKWLNVIFAGSTDVCGNGRRTGSEGCDDGNTANNDGCGSTCTVESGFSCMGGTASTPDTCQRTSFYVTLIRVELCR